MGRKKQLGDLIKDRISGIDYSYYAYRQDKNLVKNAKGMGLLTNVWTVNDAGRIATLLSTRGRLYHD